jgi:hypothetical protein
MVFGSAGLRVYPFPFASASMFTLRVPDVAVHCREPVVETDQEMSTEHKKLLHDKSNRRVECNHPPKQQPLWS